MGNDVEPAKLLLPFLQRADELQKHEPLVAYYCRLYAMERGLKIPQKERTKTTNALLVSLMNQLEKDKKSLKLASEDHLYLEGFASNVFAKADKQDRAGRADLATAKTFYAASIFFEILYQFGDITPDIEQKLKYAVWKAADIRKALKEGRKPEPGPPVEEDDILKPSASPSSENVLDSSEGIPTNFSSHKPFDQTEQDLGSSQNFNHSLTDVPSQSGEGERFNYSGAKAASQPAVELNPHLSVAHSTATLHNPSQFMPKHPGENNNFNHSGANDLSAQPDHFNPHYSHLSTSPSSYHNTDYSSTTDHKQFPPAFSQSYIPSYSPENQNLPYSYPNFQSYPSFQESSFPSAPTHQPSYYHHSDPSFSHESSLSGYPATAQHSLPSINGDNAGSSSSPAASYKYDGGYQPPAEKIAEAHKAARFAVGALAFDDVAVAVEYLRQSLELLTNSSG